MRAVVLTGHGGLDLLDVEEAWPVPEPTPDEVLVAVGACTLNATDLTTRTGWYGKGEAGGAWAARSRSRAFRAPTCAAGWSRDSAPAALLRERVLVESVTAAMPST